MCDDITIFSTVFQSVQNAIGDLGFGFSGSGELLRLYDYNGTLIDSVEYSDDPPWPIEPDGNGPSLELKNPLLDNSLGINWGSSSSNGTPGRKNDSFVKRSAFNITLYLEGAYNSSNIMNNSLSVLLDSIQPFNVSPWFYSGEEYFVEMPNENIVDWVLIELRSGLGSDTKITERAAFVDINGKVLDIDGQSDLCFYGLATGDYYIVVHHRNHLSVMSANAVSIE